MKILALAAFFISQGITASPPLEPTNATPVVFVKFRAIPDPVKQLPALTHDAENLFNRNLPFQSFTSDRSASLDSVFSTGEVISITPVFRKPDSGLQTASVQNLKSTWEEKIQNIQTRFPQRVARAPRGANIPELFHIYRLELMPGNDAEAFASLLSKDRHVEYAHVDFSIEQHAQKKLSASEKVVLAPSDPISNIANDPYFNSSGSWGQAYEDLWGLKRVRASTAWQQTNGEGQGIIVAVVDTGVDYTHPDIAENVWINSGEIPNNGSDDDGNGFVDDIRGWDFGNGDNDPYDFIGHGTHVAGTIAAVRNNGIGIVGAAPKAKILIAKGFSDNGGGNGEHLAQAIEYAALNGADVINNSWGCVTPCPSFPIAEDAVRLAYGLGVSIVFSAGNYNANAVDFSPQNAPETITVGWSDNTDHRAILSNWGLELDVVAPGGEGGSVCVDPMRESILSLRAGQTDIMAGCPSWGETHVVGENYYRLRGTSMAAPLVSAAVAILNAKRPELNTEEIRQILRSSTDPAYQAGFPDPTGPLGLACGYGRLNIEKALQVDSVLQVKIQSPSSGMQPNVAHLPGGNFLVQGSAFGHQFQRYELSYKYPGDNNNWVVVANSSTPVENGVLGAFPAAQIPLHKYNIRLLAFTQDGRQFQDVVEFETECGNDDNFGNDWPHNVSASDGTFWDAVVVQWTPVPEAVGYNVYRSETNIWNNANNSVFGTTNTNYFLDASTPPAIYQYYFVETVFACGISSHSTEGAQGWRTSGPSLPNNVAASDSQYCNKVRVSWNAVPGATTYRIYRGVAPWIVMSTNIGNVSGGNTSFDDTTATPQQIYYYWVRVGEGGFSLWDTGKRGCP